MEPTFCVLHCGGKKVLINVSSIDTIEDFERYAKVSLSSGERIRVDETMEAILESFVKS